MNIEPMMKSAATKISHCVVVRTEGRRGVKRGREGKSAMPSEVSNVSGWKNAQ